MLMGKKEEQVVTIDVPAGVEEGMQLSVRGEGNEGPNGGINGDLIVVIEEIPHEDFVRDGQNVLYNLLVSFPDMVHGNSSIEVPTLTGRAKIKIPSGTPSGKIFRLKGKGFPSVNGYGKGDQLIYVNVFIPKESILQYQKNHSRFGGRWGCVSSKSSFRKVVF